MRHITRNENVYNCGLSILEYYVLSLLNIPACSSKCLAAMRENTHLVNMTYRYLAHCCVDYVCSVDPVTLINVTFFVKLQNHFYNLLCNGRLSLQC